MKTVINVQTKEVISVDLTADEIAERESGKEERAAARVRLDRDSLLAQSDWKQVADAPVDKTAWATYRQSLRDVPSQSGFPNEVTWPVEPE